MNIVVKYLILFINSFNIQLFAFAFFSRKTKKCHSLNNSFRRGPSCVAGPRELSAFWSEAANGVPIRQAERTLIGWVSKRPTWRESAPDRFVSGAKRFVGILVGQKMEIAKPISSAAKF